METIFTYENKTVYPILYEVNYGQMKSINCYLYKDNDMLTLIDAGIDTPDFYQFFIGKLNEFGFVLQDIDQILLTHHHADHIGMVNRILQHKKVPIYAHYLAVERLQLTQEYQLQKRDFYSKLYEEYGSGELAKPRLEKMAQTLRNSEKLRIHADINPLYHNDSIQGLEVREVPGHSPDSIVFYDAQAKWLFIGDLALYTGTTNALVDHDVEGKMLPTVMQYYESLMSCVSYEVNMVFAGHQQPYADLKGIIEKNLNRITFKLNRLLQHIAAGNNTVLALATSIYGERVQKEFPLIMSEIIGYVIYAEMLGKIRKNQQSNIVEIVDVQE